MSPQPALSLDEKNSSSWVTRGILAVVCASVAIVSMYSAREVRKGTAWGIEEGQTLRIELLGRVGDTNKIRAEQIRGRAALFRSNQNNPRFVVDEGLENDELVRVTNTGRRTIQCDGFNSASPWYHIEIGQGARWGLLGGMASPGPDVVLKPGESLEFPVVPPRNERRWRIGLLYQERPSSGMKRLREAKSEPNVK